MYVIYISVPAWKDMISSQMWKNNYILQKAGGTQSYQWTIQILSEGGT